MTGNRTENLSTILTQIYDKQSNSLLNHLGAVIYPHKAPHAAINLGHGLGHHIIARQVALI